MSRSVARLVVAVAFVAAVAMGQQYNSSTASMVFNGADGPPYPVNPANLPRGVVSTCVLGGLANSPFVVFASNALAPASLFYFNGFVDISLTNGFAIALNGLTQPIWSLDASGVFNAPFTISASTPLGAAKCWQAAVADFTNPFGASLTAATRTVVTPGITTLPQSIGSNSGTSVSLTPYQLSIPFYASTYTTMHVWQDGTISFNQPCNGDFTPTDVEFLTQMPRIAAFWTDLEPGGQSTISVQIDQSTPGINVITTSWANLLEWSGTGVPHTFRIKIYAPVGDIEVQHSNFNNAAQYDILTGITPGSLSGSTTTYPWSDLSATATSPVLGTANQPIYEWFGLPSFPYYTPGLVRPFDLTGRTVYFSAIGTGATGARYAATSYATPTGY